MYISPLIWDINKVKGPEMRKKRGMINMGFLRWLGGIVLFFWLLGFLFKVGGSLIHILLIVAAVVFIYDAITGKR